jgi:hypothetical protein
LRSFFTPTPRAPPQIKKKTRLERGEREWRRPRLLLEM